MDADTPRALRVVHVVLSLNCGGLEHVVVDLARSGQEMGQHVSVICLERKGTLAVGLEATGVSVISLDKPPGLHLMAMRRNLRQILAEIRPDVVHTHQIGALFHVGRVARALGAPVVVHTEHGKHFNDRVKSRWLGRIAAWYVDRFFCVSQDIADTVLNYRIASRRKVGVVLNGIDTARFARIDAADVIAVRRELSIPIDAPVIGTVGRLAEIKRQDLLIRAFAKLSVDFPTAYLLLVGDGPRRKELEQLAANLRVIEHVRFAGYREDRERLLHAMNVFALTSRSEGMPLSILEAWAAEVPVIAAHVGGLPDLIDDGRTGVLVKGDDPVEWGHALGNALLHRQQTTELVSAAKRHVIDNLSLRSMSSNYEEQYLSLIAASGSMRRSGYN